MKDGDVQSLVVALMGEGCVVIVMVWVGLAWVMLREWQLRGGSDSSGRLGSKV